MSQSDAQKKEIIVLGQAGRIPAETANLFIGNAGTAARFLSAFLTLGQGEYILDGDTRMRERPIGDLVSSLTQLGANIGSIPLDGKPLNNEICPPVKISASGLPGGNTFISGEISSQFLSALLMVSPYAREPVQITVSTELNSKPYIDMTLAVMADFGISIQRDGYQHFTINAGLYHSLETYVIEPDASAASYFFAAPAILGGSIRINDISFHAKQGDIEFVNVLKKMGCEVFETQKFIEVVGPVDNKLVGVDIDMRDIPDTAQTLAAIAPFASTPTHIHGIASARV
ncbi:MAG: 3-phosphoshikimate 1-carboxyvinyltransferase, partial [Pseudomonadota bacterium]